MKDAVYSLSTQFGKAGLTQDKAIRAMERRNWSELNRHLGTLQTQNDGLNEPALRVTELEPLLDSALEACRG